MILFQYAWGNVKCHVREFFYCFLILSFTVTFIFFYMSVQYNEKIVDTIMVLQFPFLYIWKVLLIVCLHVSVLYVKSIFFKQHIRSVITQQLIGKRRKQVMSIFIYEQLIVSGGALIFGLFHGMLFLKLFTSVLMKITSCKDIENISITAEAVIHTVLLFVILMLFSLWRCYRVTGRNEIFEANGR